MYPKLSRLMTSHLANVSRLSLSFSVSEGEGAWLSADPSNLHVNLLRPSLLLSSLGWHPETQTTVMDPDESLQSKYDVMDAS